jgi:peptidoglycan/xylan/chitin deacetylase (PgdA/CDA1 family)
MKLRIVLPILLLLAMAGTIYLLIAKRAHVPLKPEVAAAALQEAAAHPERVIKADPLIEALRTELDIHRKLIVLFNDEAKLKGAAREAVLHLGHQFHHEDRAMVYHLDNALEKLAKAPSSQRDPKLNAVLDWIESAPELLELDRLAFRDPLRILQHSLAQDSSREGLILKNRIAKDLANVDRTEARVDAEYRQVFGSPGANAKAGERKLWNDYVSTLKRIIPQVKIPAPLLVSKLENDGEINGRELPEKVLILSFDDGPHRIYTEEIKAILQRYNVPALFFEVGRNLGTIDLAGSAKLGPLSVIAEDLVKSGYIIGNHSYTHAQLSKETGKPLEMEIAETDQLLRIIPGAHSRLFRFPYGARTSTQLEALRSYHLRSVLWNIDSLDWADPVISSITDRVLRTIAEEKRGIILFHDIHDRAGKVLPTLLERLQTEGYRFLVLDANGELAGN